MESVSMNASLLIIFNCFEDGEFATKYLTCGLRYNLLTVNQIKINDPKIEKLQGQGTLVIVNRAITKHSMNLVI